MKKTIILYLFLLCMGSNALFAQEKYGKALNLGVGLGYYGYTGHSIPVVSVNYEFDVAKNFTLAPFATVYSYRDKYYWGDKNHKHRYYDYHETVIPIGVKGSYYFDPLLKAGSKWDFYLAGSLGFALRTVSWDGDYYGDRYAYHNNSRARGLYLDAHIGAEYHFTKGFGMFLDLSSGVSTLGLAFHL